MYRHRKYGKALWALSVYRRRVSRCKLQLSTVHVRTCKCPTCARNPGKNAKATNRRAFAPPPLPLRFQAWRGDSSICRPTFHFCTGDASCPNLSSKSVTSRPSRAELRTHLWDLAPQVDCALGKRMHIQVNICTIFGSRTDWMTTRAHDRSEWRKYRAVPWAHPLHPLACSSSCWFGSKWDF